MRRLAVLGLLAGCHVALQSELVTPLETDRAVLQDQAQAGKPKLVLTDAGTLRFVEPLECPTQETVTNQSVIEIQHEPNMATFVIGVVATSVGGIMTLRGAAGDNGTPYLIGGAAGLAIGLPLAIGPWIGTSTEHRPQGKKPPETRVGPQVACGERGVAGKSATLEVAGVEMFGAVGDDGTFAVSPYALVDAFDPRKTATWDVRATLVTDRGPLVVSGLIEGGMLATKAPEFLKHASFDVEVGPMRMVPNITAGLLRASVTTTASGPALRIVLPLTNAGPGESFGLRAVVQSSVKAIDGRIMYVGKLAKGQTLNGELIVPLTQAAADGVRDTTIDMSVEMRDAHGTAPATAVQFHGAVLNDLPRSP
ncbi:MAG TPA: hypothetical protein VGM39_13270 [Kofleriaceae bacterium]